jgi:hypothetical protein
MERRWLVSWWGALLAGSYLVGREVEPVVHSQEHNSPRAVLAILIHFFLLFFSL